MKSYLSQFWTWLVTSSKDPIQTSLTVKGFLVWIVGIVMQVAPAVCMIAASLCIDTTQLNPLVDAITSFVRGALELVGIGIMIFGILRKIKLGRWSHPDALQ